MPNSKRQPITIALIVPLVLVLLLAALSLNAPSAQAVSTNVVISQVYGGGGNLNAIYKNDFIEIFNRGSSTVDLTGWSVQYNSATSTTGSFQVTNLSGTLQPGQYYLVQEAVGAGGTTNLPPPDAVGSISMSATAGKVALVNSTTALTGSGCPIGSSVVDFVGFGTTANCSETSPAPAPSNTTADLRAANGCTDTDANNTDFTAGAPNPRNTSSTFNSCGPTNTPSGPTNTPTLSPTPTNTPVPLQIHDVQGASHISPYRGSSVNVPGIVIAKISNGFWIEDPNPDADDSTSEGIFVFTSSAPTVSVGDAVTVSGLVSEFRPGGTSDPDGLTITELDSPHITVQSSGNPTPTPVLIGTGGRVPPNQVIENDASCGNVETCNTFDPSEDGLDFWESVEGMLIQFNNPIVVGPSELFSGNSVEIPIVGDGGANASLQTPHGGVIVQPGNLNPERVILNNAVNRDFLTNNLNVGDHVNGSILGVMDYDFGNYYFQTIAPVSLTSGGLTRESTTAQSTDQLAVATFNVENLAPSDPASKFNTLATLIVNNLKAPDIIGVEEIQDNNGVTDNGNVDATTTWNTLITAISSAGRSPPINSAKSIP